MNTPGADPSSIQNCAASCAYRLMAMAFLLVSAAGWLRLFQAISTWYWLNFSGVQPGPLYLAAGGALWGVAGAAGFLWLVRGLPWARLTGIGVVFFCLITYWADRLLFTRAPYAGSNTGFSVIVSILALWYALALLRPGDEFRRLLGRLNSSREGSAGPRP